MQGIRFIGEIPAAALPALRVIVTIVVLALAGAPVHLSQSASIV